MRKQFAVHRSEQDSWWRVMCLTGVDYFSSLSYAPGIAYLAAGILSPLATVVLVLLTLFGAVPVYYRVASRSPHGQGSIAMLERLLPGWRGKLFVLCLLGFAATDFIITITLSAADAATHLVQNPLLHSQALFLPVLDHRMALTMFMLAILGGIFLRGFKEAIGLAVILVVFYLGLSSVIIVNGLLFHLAVNPWMVKDWWHQLMVDHHGSVWNTIGLSCLMFPKLALGLSGFETGVAVMPLVKGDSDESEVRPVGRIKNTKKLLLVAAIIMSLFLLGSSFCTALLIPAKEFLPEGQAYGRAIAYLAHQNLGVYFGTAYDISTVLILWFAGASAMAGLLSLVPRYLPRFGMAPEWAKARRPLVIFYTLVSFAVTWIFKADVEAQGSAYATGVLVVMTSAAIASFLTTLKEPFINRIGFLFLTFVFCYTTTINMIERPDGIKIASFFILVIMITSFTSRIMRSTELRIHKVSLDAQANAFVEMASSGVLRLVAHRPGNVDYAQKAIETVALHNISEDEIIFVEVKISDASDFGDEELDVSGERVGRYKVLKCSSTAVPNALAALMLYLRDKTQHIPHLYLGWTEGNPVTYILKYLTWGEGETAPVTREILRKAEPNPNKRPRVHVG
jgi:hypothetical protein